MAYLPAVLTLLAVVLGVFGKSWDSDKLGVARVTLKGWLAIALALASAALSIQSLARQDAEKAAYRKNAHADIVAAANRLLDPFRSIYIQFKGPGFLPHVSPLSEQEGLARLQAAIPASELISEGFLTYLAKFKVLELSGDVRSGTQLPYLDHIAIRTAEGRAGLEKTVVLAGEIIAVPIRTSIVEVLREPYAQSAEARPSAICRLHSATDHTILPLPATGRDDVIDEYKNYVNKVDALRQAATAQ